jgi:hypothetical protein
MSRRSISMKLESLEAAKKESFAEISNHQEAVVSKYGQWVK